MNKRRQSLRIVLKRNTLRQLSTSDLQHVGGASGESCFNETANLAAEDGAGGTCSASCAAVC